LCLVTSYVPFVEPLPDHVIPRRVVIIGGGFAGLLAARRLRRCPLQITLVDRSANHVFQPLLFQCATGGLNVGQIAPPLRGIFRGQDNVRVLLAEVVGFDLPGRTVHASAPDGCLLDLGYDHLIVAAGTETSYFGHDELAVHAPGLKSINDAQEVRRRIFGAFESAELARDPEERASWLTFVVVGAGPTGVEMAGQIRELAARTLRDEFHAIDPSRCRVILADGAPEPLGAFGHHLAGRAARTLRHLGVELRMDTLARAIDATGVELQSSDGTVARIGSRTVIWAAGVHASPLAAMLVKAAGAGADRQGRVLVEPDCTLPGHPEVFCVGDMMNLRDLPGVAEVAMQSGLHAANMIRRSLLTLPSNRPFRYLDLGSAAYLARGHGLVEFHGLKLSGFSGWMTWLAVHITFLTGFTNRAAALLTWLFALGGRRRSQRTLELKDIQTRPQGRLSTQAPHSGPAEGTSYRNGP
jgi:NADH dehydrogenase